MRHLPLIAVAVGVLAGAPTFVAAAPARPKPADLPLNARPGQCFARVDVRGRPAWAEAPCARAVTPVLVRRVQRALNGRGYSVGRSDGVFGPRTLAALERFQRDRRLATGALTLESLRALKVEP